MSLFFSHKRDRWTDSWTYGDWQQWICNRPGGETQCARGSNIPWVSFLLGLAFAVMIGLPMATWPPESIVWERAIPGLVVSVLMAVWPVALFFSPWVLMVPVGPMNKGTRRVLHGDQP